MAGFCRKRVDELYLNEEEQQQSLLQQEQDDLVHYIRKMRRSKQLQESIVHWATNYSHLRHIALVSSSDSTPLLLIEGPMRQRPTSGDGDRLWYALPYEDPDPTNTQKEQHSYLYYLIEGRAYAYPRSPTIEYENIWNPPQKDDNTNVDCDSFVLKLAKALDCLLYTSPRPRARG